MGRLPILIILLLSLLLVYILKYKNIPISYYDENYWIAKSYQASYLGKDSSEWNNFISYDQPPVVGYMYYFFLYKTYKIYGLKNENYKEFLFRHNFIQFEGNKTPIPWGNNPMAVSNVKKETLIQVFGPEIKKTIEIIFSIRKHNILLWMGNLIIISVLLYILRQNSLFCGIMLVLYGLNYYLSKYGLMAQSDTLFLTLFNLNILFFLLLGNKKDYIWVIILAFFEALLFQTKINGVMIGMFIVVFYIWKRQWVKMALYTCSFFIFSILLNPTLMHWDFIWRTYHYFEVRHFVERGQIENYYSSHITNAIQVLWLFFDHYFFKNVRGYYNILLPYSWIYKILFISWLIGIVEQWKKQRIIVAIFVWVFIVTATYLRLDWDRYWLHLTFFVYYFELCGVFYIIRWGLIKLHLQHHIPVFKNTA